MDDDQVIKYLNSLATIKKMALLLVKAGPQTTRKKDGVSCAVCESSFVHTDSCPIGEAQAELSLHQKHCIRCGEPDQNNIHWGFDHTNREWVVRCPECGIHGVVKGAPACV